jgi:antitoxin component of RelBE/YafQ-DinJ toxin-antitoxin module
MIMKAECARGRSTSEKAPEKHVAHCIDNVAKTATAVAMARTTILRARVEPRRKAAAEKILHRFGITLPQFINMSLAQLELRGSLPFNWATDERVPAKAEVIAFWNKTYDDDYSR